MSKRVIVALKAVLHLLLFAPAAYLLWIFQNGKLATYADPVNYLTHFTGNWTLWILLGSLAITPLRRLSPHIAWLIRLRRMVGLYAFFYALLHLSTYVFLFSGYDLPTAIESLRAGHPGDLVTQGKLVWPTIWDDLRKRRFIQVGLASFVLLLALALTSPTAALRAMGGKAWQQLHRLVYLAAIFGVIHYWWLVKAGVRRPAVDTLILALLLAARLVYVALKRVRKPLPAHLAKA